MEKVKYLIIKFMNNKESLIDILVRLGSKGSDLLREIIYKAQGEVFVSDQDTREKIMRRLDISKPTYLKRLKILEDEGLIKIYGSIKGIYSIDTFYADVITELERKYVKTIRYKKKEGKL